MELVKYILAPIFLLQGRRIKRTVPRLKAPKGNRQGTQGQGERLRILLLGDSSGEGVGADTFEQSLMGQLLEQLPNYEIDWCVLAKSGHTSLDALNHLINTPNQTYDVAILALGVNDVTSQISLKQWIQVQSKIYHKLQEDFQTQKIIVSGIPPMWDFPALPQPLRWYLGTCAKKFDTALQNHLNSKSTCYYLNLNFAADCTHMAHDGFHPGPLIYAQWATEVINTIKELALNNS